MASIEKKSIEQCLEDADAIEGELVAEEPQALKTDQGMIPVARDDDNPHQVTIVYNPLDAEPVEFARALVSRSQNYDALALHLRGILAAGKDFGRIHIAKKGTGPKQCPAPWSCSYEDEPYHWTPYSLFSPGADKVLGILGLGVTYPDESDYRRAALKGLFITDVIMKCFVDNGRGQVISEGLGAATRSQENDDLNRTIKKAGKRARVDAVQRLPSISALFEDDFLEQMDREQATKKNSATRRGQKIGNQHNTGAELTTWPLKGELEGQRFADMEYSALCWIVEKILDKPDINAAAVKELEKRAASSKAPSKSTADGPAKAEQGDRQQGQAAGGSGPVTNDYNDYPEAQ